MLNMNNNEHVILIENKEKLCFTPERKLLSQIIEFTFSSLDPASVMERELSLHSDSKYGNGKLYVVGFGKASLSMYEGVRRFTSKRAAYSALIIPEGENTRTEFPELELLRGNHPIPGEDTCRSSSRLLSAIEKHEHEDTYVVLISGGGSALFEIPRDNTTIGEIGQVAKCMMNSGADIRELNMVRQLMSKVKGGKLAETLYPSRVFSYVISDVPGDDLQLIASGPLTRPDYAEEDVRAILNKYSPECPLLNDLSGKDLFHVPDSEVFENVHQKIILKNYDFVKEISSFLSSRKQKVVTIDYPIKGSVEEVADLLSVKAREIYGSRMEPVWLVGGGETTAVVRGKGTGGRNCELSLRLVLKMHRNEEFLFSSIGTDGIDGVSPAMGGVVDSWFRSRVPDSDIAGTLEDSDSYSLLSKHNSAIITGYTGTNVSDVFIMYYGGTGKGGDSIE